MTLTATGLALGLLGAVAISRALRTLLYETSPFDPLAFGAMAGLLATTAFIACWLPARRAANSDPLVGLRAE
jgi:putative ABC transport system permease protein